MAMQVIQLQRPEGSTVADVLGGLSDVLMAYYGSKQSEAERKRKEQEQAYEREVQGIDVQSKLRKLAEEEAARPIPGERPTISLPSVSTQLPAEPAVPELGLAEGAPGPMVPLSPGFKAPEPVSTAALPPVSFMGREVLPSRQAPRLYAGELAEQERAQKRKGLVESGQAVEVTQELHDALPPAVKGMFQVGSVIPASLAGTVATTLGKPTKSEWSTPFTGPDKVSYQRNEATGEIRRTPGVGRAPATEGGDVADVFPGLFGADLESKLKQTSAQDYTNVQQIIAGRMDPTHLASMRKGRREYLVGLASRIDPTFDGGQVKNRYATRKDFGSGKQGANIRSINTAIQHLGTLDRTTKDLDATGYPWINAGINFWRQKTGDPRLNAVRKSTLAVATEMAAALKGGSAAPTTEEINHQLKVFSEANSPAQWRAIIETDAELLAGRLRSLDEQWTDTFGAPPERSFIRPDARKVAKQHDFLAQLEHGSLTGNADGGDGAQSADPGGLFGAGAAPPQSKDPAGLFR